MPAATATPLPEPPASSTTLAPQSSQTPFKSTNPGAPAPAAAQASPPASAPPCLRSYDASREIGGTARPWFSGHRIKSSTRRARGGCTFWTGKAGGACSAKSYRWRIGRSVARSATACDVESSSGPASATARGRALREFVAPFAGFGGSDASACTRASFRGSNAAVGSKHDSPTVKAANALRAGRGRKALATQAGDADYA
jgi:hypothetical protein